MSRKCEQSQQQRLGGKNLLSSLRDSFKVQPTLEVETTWKAVDERRRGGDNSLEEQD
jgi:hypothetical protein